MVLAMNGVRAWVTDEGVRWVIFFAWVLLAIGLGLLAGWAVGDVRGMGR